MNTPKEVTYLTIPTEPAPTHVPLGMTKEDLALVRATLDLWEHRIAPRNTPLPPLESFAGCLADVSSEGTGEANKQPSDPNVG